VIAFGAIFEWPLVLLILVYSRSVSASFPQATTALPIAGNAFLAMVLAPPDLVSIP